MPIAINHQTNDISATGAGSVTIDGAVVASTTAGAVGTYALMQRRSGTGTLNEGSTIAGSSIAFANINWSAAFTSYGSGTWRVMGIFVGSGTGSTNYITVCVRIS
jgi:hypothetical protein